MPDILGMASSAIGGQIMGAVDAARNWGYSKRGMDYQKDIQKELGRYNQDLAKEMWDYTNFENQKEHMKKAGLNPALMYAKGGPGGTTAGGAAGPVGIEKQRVTNETRNSWTQRWMQEAQKTFQGDMIDQIEIKNIVEGVGSILGAATPKGGGGHKSIY